MAITRKVGEDPITFLDRLRAIANLARISQKLVKEKFLMGIADQYPALDPFTIQKITTFDEFSTQKMAELLEEYKDK